jgi:hypothetical protein
MSNFSLHQRFVTSGTISEPNGVPDPGLALASTVNWMRALAMLVTASGLNFATATTFYGAVQKNKFSEQEENTVLEQLLFALHQVSAMEAMKQTSRKADLARVASVAWYYGIYAASSAMVTAQAKTIQYNHTQTANAFDRQLAAMGLVMSPFSFRLSTLVLKDVEQEIRAYRNGNMFVLTSPATNRDDARGACCAYLSGNADWWKWKVEQAIRSSSEFRALNVANFRTKAAREIRDKNLSKKSVCFLHQAIRYRGKANYREALYLAHGLGTEAVLSGFIDDLASVLAAFVAAAGAFVSRRLGTSIWTDFNADLEKYRSFLLSPRAVWA